MNNNKQPMVDPIDLIKENFDSIEMSDARRRELLSKTRNLVSARQKKHTLGLRMCLVGTAIVAILIALVWSATRPASPIQKTENTTVHRNRAAEKALKHDQLPKDICHILIKNGRVGPETVTAKIDQVPKNGETGTSAITNKIIADKTPIVVITSAQQPVIGDNGQILNLGERVSARKTIKTGRGGRAILVTPKGSELCLDSNSELFFSNASEAIIRRGRLYCTNRNKEIARIDTPAGNIKLLGTVVDTAVVSKDTVAVTVVEGKVRLSNTHGSATVDAGKQSLLAAFSAPQAGKLVNTRSETAWYQGRGEFQSDLGDLAYVINKDDLLSEVWVMNADGSNRRRVATYVGKAELGGWTPGSCWLRVNSRLPVGQDGNSWLLNTATGQSILSKYLPEGYSGFSDAYYIVAPNPMLVAFPGTHWLNHDDYESGVFVYDLSTDRIARVLEGNIKTAPAWAPDSRHIAISAGEGYTLDHKLLIIDTVTGEIRDLGINGAGACFSPDGKKIAYTSDFDEHSGYDRGIPGGALFTLDLAAGSKPVQILPKSERATNLRWSPDGGWILYIKNWYALAVANVNGGDPTTIYDSKGMLIDSAAWAPSGDSIYVTIEDRDQKSHTLLIKADGSSSKEVLNEGIKQEGKLPPAVQAQTNAAVEAIGKAKADYYAAKDLRFRANITGTRQKLTSVADAFTSLVWDYPLSGLYTEDTIQYAGSATAEASCTDQEMLEQSCCKRMAILSSNIFDIVNDDLFFPQDIDALRLRLLKCGYKDADLLLHCPVLSCDVIYSPPPVGELPQVGDVLVSCPNHPNAQAKWQGWMTELMNNSILVDAKPGACRVVYPTPYAFENVGTDPLTVIYHRFTNKYEIKGTAKLLPTGQILSNEELTLPVEEGEIARKIDACGSLDWGDLSEKARAENELIFCRAVAKYQVGTTLTTDDWPYLFDGEPARLIFKGNCGSWGALSSNTRFEWLGPEDVTMYQLRPSGRFRVFGRVRVVGTDQVCKNGWIDKDGKVISSEK